MKCVRRSFCIALMAGALSGCGALPVAEAPEADEPAAVAVTAWTDATELFMEYPPLVAGDEARFAIHLTNLADFTPLREGRVAVRLEGASVQRFEVDGPSTPGIFGVTVKVPAARSYQMAIELRAPGLVDEHLLGLVTVHPTTEAAQAAAGDEEDEGISFLKEQQWTLDFRTMVVSDEPRRAVTVVPATVEPRSGGSAEVRATAAGRLATGGDRVVGTRVARGDVLAELIVRNERVGQAPVLRLELANAEAELRLAERELARVRTVAEAGAVPMRRLDEARVALETATARVDIAREQLRHLELSRTGEGTGETGERVSLRAPLSGVIAESAATPGATVDAGQFLYRIVSLDRVHVVGALPERQLADVRGVTTAEVVVPGVEPAPASRLVSIGRVVDRDTRTVPVVFALDSPPSVIAIGQAVSLRLIGAAVSGGVSLPADAIVDDGGQPVVFVQSGGESFERRPVRIAGVREGGYVQVAAGVAPGDRVVTRGAHLIRLAALSPQAPAHGHVH